MRQNILLGSMIGALGIVGILLTAQVPSTTFTDDPGPHVFPYFASSILVLCGLGMFFTANKNRPDQQEEPFLDRQGWIRVGIMLAVFSLYALALWLVGFHIATPFAGLAFYALIAGKEKRNWLYGIVFALLSYACLYFLFISVLNSFLPEGILMGGY
ncbi:tripartite tricarboxylate transporter TctB family protein [uncultured Cohaesibacter sp.]|uniref:tripartite tricarboxylate transporter TctB family protein n=1 Tax=uncultured Cohaesibacter sp. TaxID=1002546 RepID=UPI0029C7B092|nr:tripartite tricarboxylate transporter TctB family protein [uncultured Cohaesibacter sp.]